MKKDQLTDQLKASRLVVKDSGATLQSQSSSMDVEAPQRVISDVRTIVGSRGVPKSGRIWKRVKSQRFSRIRNDKPDRTSWQVKQEGKSDKAALKLFAQSVKAEKLEREQAERQQAAERKRIKLENEKKNEIVVPIKNMAKIKRMRKKQLRSISKR